MRQIVARPVAVLFVIALAMVAVMPAAAQQAETFEPDESFADPAFRERWARTDLPVAQDRVERTWIWGPGPFTEGLTERYDDSPGGKRLVQYFDKSRMEINQPDAQQSELWYVTNGLLVVEMVEGKIQVGDAEYVDAEPAEVSIAGDPNQPNGPTYADINRLDLRSAPALEPGTLITEALTDENEVANEKRLGDYGVVAAHRVQVPGIDHTIAEPFWDFMNSSGILYGPSASLGGEDLTGQLFPNPFYATGYPITEAYWSTVRVGGEERDVLWQCFERRCLTYTPDNPEGFVVEAGNVGQHYYRWRYGDDQSGQAEQGSPEAAVQVVRDYYAAINAGDFERAYQLWADDGQASGQTFEEFKQGYAETEHVEVTVGTPGEISPAAGSRYIEIPVTITATTTDGRTQHFEGTYTLRRGVVTGATPEQREWHIDSADIVQVDATAGS